MTKVKMTPTGLNGNAFAIMAEFKNKAWAQGWSLGQIDDVIQEASSGDYDHLLQTIMSNVEYP